MTERKFPARLYRAGTIESVRMEGADDDDRRVRLSFSSEEPALQGFGWEVLGHQSHEADFSRLNSGTAPLLEDHIKALNKQHGVVESAAIIEGRGEAVVRFGKSPAASEMLARVRDGEVTSVSVGYHIEAATLTGKRDGHEVYRMTKWVPFEISLVAIPADSTVGIGRSSDGAEGGEITITIENEVTMTKPNEKSATETKRSEAQIGQDFAARERGRLQEIGAMAREFDLPADMVRKAENEGTTAEEFNRSVLKRISEDKNSDATRARETKIGLSDKEVQSFSMIRAIRALSNPNDRGAQEEAAFEIEASRAAEDALGKSARGLIIPADILADGAFGQRDQTVGTATAGGNLVPTDLAAGSFIDLLRKRSALLNLGVTFLPGLSGNMAIPRQTAGGTGYWVGENGAPTESGLAFDLVNLTPHTLGAAVPISRRALMQTSPAIENLVRSDLIRIMALELSRCGLNGDADPDAPDGLADNANITPTAWAAGIGGLPTWGEMVDLETKVASDDADVETMRYLFNAGIRGHLKQTPTDAGSGKMAMDGKIVNGYDAVVSNQAITGDAWFGNWSDFVVAMWSGLDLTIDTAANAANGGIVLRAFQDVDFGQRHDESFARGKTT